MPLPAIGRGVCCRIPRRCAATEAKGSQRGAYEVPKGWHRHGGQAKRNRLRRLPGSGRMVVASSPMRPMRSHRLLRYVTKSACIETQRRYGSSGHHELRAGRALVLRLSYERNLRRPEASRSSHASVGPAGTGTGRSGALKLANAASRIGCCSALHCDVREGDE